MANDKCLLYRSDRDSQIQMKCVKTGHLVGNIHIYILPNMRTRKVKKISFWGNKSFGVGKLMIRALMQENLSSRFANNKSMQSDQYLCYSLIGKYHIDICYKGNFYFLNSLYSWADWFGDDQVGNPEDTFSCVKARVARYYLYTD